MLSALKSLVRNKPYYVMIYLLVLILLLGSSLIEYRTRYADLVAMVQDQAAMTAAVIAQSSSGHTLLSDELEAAYLDHAYDLTALFHQIADEQNLSHSELLELVPQNSLIKFAFMDGSGHLLATSGDQGNDSERSAVVEPWVESQISKMVADSVNHIELGIRAGLNSTETNTPSDDGQPQFLLASKGQSNRIIAAYLDRSDEKQLYDMISMESALAELIKVKGMEYLMLSVEDEPPYFATKYNYDIDSTWLRTPLEDILYLVQKGEDRLLEIVRPIFFETGIGEVRIGFSGESLFGLKRQMVYEVILRTLLLTLLSLVILIFLITRQNALFLETEKTRIEAEVYRLERLNRQHEKQAAMGELAAGVAHEIRNPLNAIGIIAQRLKREFVPGEDLAEYTSLTGSMSQEIQRINKTLQDFLDYTKPTPLELARVNARVFLDEALNLYRSEAQEKGIGLEGTSDDIEFNADPKYLAQALTNLIKNAIDASASGSKVEVEIGKSRAGVRIQVTDHGVGMDEKDLNRIFDLYYSTKDMGTGVGLALTHKIIADHHGQIEVQSKAGQGSIFIIQLPVTA